MNPHNVGSVLVVGDGVGWESWQRPAGWRSFSGLSVCVGPAGAIFGSAPSREATVGPWPPPTHDKYVTRRVARRGAGAGAVTEPAGDERRRCSAEHSAAEATAA